MRFELCSSYRDWRFLYGLVLFHTTSLDFSNARRWS
jgi:hypothetical protein